MDPIPNINPISQIAKEMDIDISSIPKPSEVAQAVIDKLVKEKLLWDDQKVNVIVNSWGSRFNLEASINKVFMELPPLYFISKDDALYFLATGQDPNKPLLTNYIPLSGPDDPRLDDKVRLQNFSDYLSSKLGLSSQQLTWEDRMHLRIYISAIHNQTDRKINDTLTFIIMHELGHAMEGHRKRKTDYSNKLNKIKYVFINILTLGLFKQIAKDIQSRKHEKEADRFGYTGLYAKPEGGIHLFKTVKEFKPKGCRETIAYALFCFSTLGSHGTYGKRGKRIKKHLKSLNISK